MRGDLLEKLGRREEARAEFLRAAELTQNARERALLMARAGKADTADQTRPVSVDLVPGDAIGENGRGAHGARGDRA